MRESLSREVRSCTSHCDRSSYSLSICMLDRHLHIILKVKKIQKYTRWTGPQPVKPFIFVTWPMVAGPQTGRIPHTKQSRASWERWLGRIPCCCCLRISRPQQDLYPLYLGSICLKTPKILKTLKSTKSGNHPIFGQTISGFHRSGLPFTKSTAILIKILLVWPRSKF